MDTTTFIIIYAIGCIATLVIMPIFIYKNTGSITTGNIIMTVLFATASWLVVIALAFTLICMRINMDKSYLKRRSNMELAVCKICNQLDDPKSFVPCEIRTIMEQEGLCFHCAFWKLRLRERTKDTFIVNGSHYTGHLEANMDTNKAKRFAGFGGADFFVKYLADGRIEHYNNVWHQGEVPDWPEFKDNAVFITREEYNEALKSK